jgi:glutathione S-transferase
VDAASWEPGSDLEELKRVNPLAQIPTLVLPDGVVMTESAAILVHLGLAYPASRLLPDDAHRASVLRGLVYIAANCYAAIGVIDYPERWCQDADEDDQKRIKAGTTARLHALWDVFADTFPSRPFLTGERIGALDLWQPSYRNGRARASISRRRGLRSARSLGGSKANRACADLRAPLAWYLKKNARAMPVSSAAVATLLSHPAIWRGDDVAPEPAAVPSGYAELDAALPGRGWPQGALTELLLEREGIGEIRLTLPAIAHLTVQRRDVVWIAPPHTPYAPALAAAGWISRVFTSSRARHRRMRCGRSSNRCAHRNAAPPSRGLRPTTSACCGDCRSPRATAARGACCGGGPASAAAQPPHRCASRCRARKDDWRCAC